MKNYKESSGNELPPSKTFHELMNLLLKLNAALREKISPAKRKKDDGAEKMDVVIIIMTHEEEKARPERAHRMPKPESPPGDWIQDLCREIEQEGRQRKKE